MATYTCPTGHNRVGQLDVQNTINNPAVVAGDKIVIPTGDWVWDTAVTVDLGFNITLIGGSATSPTWANRPHITMSGSKSRYLIYVCYDSTSPARKTAEIGYLNFEGVTTGSGYMLETLGVTNIQRLAGPPVSYIGGLRIHHCTWSWLPNNVTGNWWHAEGWFEGVMDHCEFTNPDLTNFHAKNCELNTHRTSPQNLANDIGGDYSYRTSLLDEGRQELGGSIHSFVWEDCIIHHGTRAFTDTGGGVDDGTGIWCVRHTTLMGSNAVHGTRETGSRQRGGRLLEHYNNHYFRPLETLINDPQSYGALESRDAEQIYYNNFITVQAGGDVNGRGGTRNYGGDCSNYLRSYCQSFNYWWHGPDGLCPWDDNQTGTFTEDDPGNGVKRPGYPKYIHAPYTGYNFTRTGDSTIFGGKDTVAQGVDTTTGLGQAYFSDVYGVATGGTPNTNRTSIVGCTIAFTPTASTPGNPPVIPINYFYGFVVRNPSLARDSQAAFSFVQRSTAGTPAAPNTVTLTLAPIMIGASNPNFILNWNTSGMELRKVRQYFGSCGFGSIPIAPVRNPNAATPNLAILSDGTTRWQNPVSSGVWRWGNMRRTGGTFTGTGFTPDLRLDVNDPIGVNATPPNANIGNVAPAIVGGYHHYNGGPATDIFKTSTPNAAQAEFQELFNRGYAWNPNIQPPASETAGPQVTRVGADWGMEYKNTSGTVLMSTVGPESKHPITGSKANTVTPEFASFFKPGAAGNMAYPHPLVAAAGSITPVGPEITINDNFTPPSQPWTTTGTGQSFQLSATGDVPITWTLATGETLPSWVTLSSAGLLEQAGTPVAGDASFKVTATNSTSSDTETFTLRVSAPGTGVTLSDPKDGDSIAITPPATTTTVSVSATVTNGSGATTFFNDSTTPPTQIGSSSTPDSNGIYTISWANVGVGTYSLRARNNSVNSTNSVSITVAIVNPTLEPPTITVTA